MDSPEIAVIIPVFNGIDFTKKCLKNLFEHKAKLGPEGDLLNIVVVDDGSKDGTADWIRKSFPSVHLVFGDGSLWWSGGINKGVEYALNTLNSDYILWWNNDVMPREDYFQQLFKIISKIPTHVIAGSKIFGMHNNLVWGMGGKFDPVKGTRYMHGERQHDNDSLQQAVEVDWFPGMGTVIHQSVFQKIGMLDNANFPQYHGDSDFTLRAKAAGFKLIAYPELVIYNDNTNTGLFHNGSFSRLYQSLTSIKSIYGVRKDYLFLKTHATSPRAYFPLVMKYFYYIGGFLKWKALNFIGIQRLPDEHNQQKLPQKQPG